VDDNASTGNGPEILSLVGKNFGQILADSQPDCSGILSLETVVLSCCIVTG
jgi:hypothetical protein